MKLTHIVPALAPQIDGVGDYALNLARQLRQTADVESRFIVCDPNWPGASRVDGFPVRRIRVQTAAGLWSLLPSGKDGPPLVMLHYAARAYERHAAPLWLYSGIKSWWTEQVGLGQKQLATVFHDTCGAFGWGRKRLGLRAFFQHWLAVRFHRLSTFSVAGTRAAEAFLNRVEPNKAHWLPMPSNVPALGKTTRPASPATPLTIAIFGKAEARLETVKAHALFLSTLDRNRLLSKVALMGSGTALGAGSDAEVECLRQSVGPERIEARGELSVEEVSASLSAADLFLSHRRGEGACESGALMAALAMGCPAALRDGRNASPLREGEHFLASDDTRPAVERLKRLAQEGNLWRVGTAARAWYEKNADWKVIGHAYETALTECASRASAKEESLGLHSGRRILGGPMCLRAPAS